MECHVTNDSRDRRPTWQLLIEQHYLAIKKLTTRMEKVSASTSLGSIRARFRLRSILRQSVFDGVCEVSRSSCDFWRDRHRTSARCDAVGKWMECRHTGASFSFTRPTLGTLEHCIEHSHRLRDVFILDTQHCTSIIHVYFIRTDSKFSDYWNSIINFMHTKHK